MEKSGVSRNEIVNKLLHIGHGDLKIYADLGLRAVREEPELFAHVIAWNEKKGEVRDSKTAFPIIALRGKPDEELFENAAAHLCLLDPKNLVKAARFHRELPSVSPTGGTWLKKAIQIYLKEREKNRGWWNATALQHRQNLKTLYAMYHVKPSDYAERILFRRDYPEGSVFAQLAQIRNMSAQEAAGTILNFKVPFLVAVGALGGLKGKTDIVLALIERMSGNELINNTNMLKKCGVFENPTLKAAYDSAVARMAKSNKKVNTLKAGRAAQAVGDEKVAQKLSQIQEQRLEKLGGIDGDWLVLGDRSGSMQTSIEVARQVSALIAQQVKGKVYLVFFNNAPYAFDVTGKSLEEISNETRRIMANGGTSIGCGLDMIYEKGIVVNGIVLCSDGGENQHPIFSQVYAKYAAKYGVEPSIYFYRVPGDWDVFTNNCIVSGISLQTFDLGGNVDYYSLPNLVRTMRTSRYSLVDEIMETPLLTLKDVFKGGK